MSETTETRTEIETLRALRLGDQAQRIGEVEKLLKRSQQEWADLSNAYESLSEQVSLVTDEISADRTRDPAMYRGVREQFIRLAFRALTRPQLLDNDGKPDYLHDSEALDKDEAGRILERPCFSCRHATGAIMQKVVNVGCRKLQDDMILSLKAGRVRVPASSVGPSRAGGIPDIEFCPHRQRVYERAGQGRVARGFPKRRPGPERTRQRTPDRTAWKGRLTKPRRRPPAIHRQGPHRHAFEPRHVDDVRIARVLHPQRLAPRQQQLQREIQRPLAADRHQHLVRGGGNAAPGEDPLDQLLQEQRIVDRGVVRRPVPHLDGIHRVAHAFALTPDREQRRIDQAAHERITVPH